VDRHQTESWGKPRVGEHLQSDALILQQSFRYPEYHADDAVAASGTAHCAVVTVDYHWFSWLGRDCHWHLRPLRLIGVCHLAGPLGLCGGLDDTLTAGTDISGRPKFDHWPATRRAKITSDVGATA
jgi:hypothetical protein